MGESAEVSVTSVPQPYARARGGTQVKGAELLVPLRDFASRAAGVRNRMSRVVHEHGRDRDALLLSRLSLVGSHAHDAYLLAARLQDASAAGDAFRTWRNISLALQREAGVCLAAEVWCRDVIDVQERLAAAVMTAGLIAAELTDAEAIRVRKNKPRKRAAHKARISELREASFAAKATVMLRIQERGNLLSESDPPMDLDLLGDSGERLMAVELGDLAERASALAAAVEATGPLSAIWLQ